MACNTKLDPMIPQPTSKPPTLALLACSVFEKEIELFTQDAEHLAEIRFYEMGLHDNPENLRSTLQAELATLDARTDIDAIILAYGLCGLGTSGLHSLKHKVVIPRAHDCITVFMGSKEAYANHQKKCPGCYYYTPGWNRGRRVPGPEMLAALRERFSEQFDPEDVEFLIETEQQQLAMHDTASYLDLGTVDAEDEAKYAKKCADGLGWKFEHLPSDGTLLRDLLWGNWDDERFQTIVPGMKLCHSPDDSIMKVEAAESPAAES